MGRADELRAQLATLEAEDLAEAGLRAARDAFRAAPGDPAAKAAAQDAARGMRAVRAGHRAARDWSAMLRESDAAEAAYAARPSSLDAALKVAAARRVMERLRLLVSGAEAAIDATVAPATAVTAAAVRRAG